MHPFSQFLCQFTIFIFFPERFLSKASVTNVTTSSAGLTWRPGPNVSDYRLEVRGDKNLTENLTDLAYDLVNLTAGTKYSVQVVPVKCDRDLHSQKVMFYTSESVCVKKMLLFRFIYNFFFSLHPPYVGSLLFGRGFDQIPRRRGAVEEHWPPSTPPSPGLLNHKKEGEINELVIVIMLSYHSQQSEIYLHQRNTS